MALNKAQRNGLRNTIIRCRRLLEEATSSILEGRFGNQRTGEVGDPSQPVHPSGDEFQYREQVASHLQPTQATGVTAKEAMTRLARAANFDLAPDLNVGVVLNITSLHELVPWSEAASTWKELIAGKYKSSSIVKQLRAKGIAS